MPSKTLSAAISPQMYLGDFVSQELEPYLKLIGKADFYSDHNLSYYISRIVVHFSLVECVVATKIKREDCLVKM